MTGCRTQHHRKISHADAQNGERRSDRQAGATASSAGRGRRARDTPSRRTTGPHPQGGVAIARSIDEARQRLADMLIFCDPAAAAVADITAFTPTRTGARYSGTVADLFAAFNTGTPDRTVLARRCASAAVTPGTWRWCPLA